MQLKVYIDRGPRSELAIQQLTRLGVNFEIERVHESVSAAAFLLNQNRPPAKHPLPQYYVGNTVAWENGYKDVVNLTVEAINQRIEEINATFN